MKINKILVPTDFSDSSEQTLAYAVKLAMAFDSEVTMLHIIALFQDDPNNPAYHFPNIEDVLASLEQNANSHFDKLRAAHDHLSIKKEIARAISPAEEIINYAKSENFDLIVMGTHGRTGLRHFLMGSVAERVIRQMPCPVLTIKQQFGEKVTLPAFEKFVIAVDFSNYSKMALATATEIAQAFSATLEVLYVIEEQVHPAYYVTGETTVTKMFPELRPKSITALREFARGVIPESVEHSLHVREGKVHAEIVDFADEQNADLIFVATHGLSGLDNFLIGSTTEKVVRKANAPVFTIRAEGI